MMTPTETTPVVDAVIAGAGFAELVRPTLFETADTWYMGANIPGKPRVFMPHLGFVGPYRAKCDEVLANGFEGFVFDAGLQPVSPR